jgi:hypothetical protein
MNCIYHLELEARFCKVLGIVNGFPIYQLDGTHPAVFSKPINSALVGKENKIDFVITPAYPFEPNRGEYAISGSIKKYSANDFTGPDQGEIVHAFTYEKMPAASFTFHNDIFDFSEVLKNSEPFEDKDAIVDYALKLLKLIDNRDVSSLLQEFKLKLRDYAICYSMQADELYAQFVDYINEKIFTNEPFTNFSKEEINLQSWCDKRIWEIGIGIGSDELIRTTPNDEEIEYATRVFVGLVNGEIKVVR